MRGVKDLETENAMTDNPIDNESFEQAFKREELGWRKVVLLPFNIYWHSIVILTVVSVYFYQTFITFFRRNQPYTHYVVVPLALCRTIYVLDTMFFLIHKFWTSVAQSSHYPTKHWFLLIIDIISISWLDVMYEGAEILNPDGYINWGSFLVLVPSLRIYRVFQFLGALSSNDISVETKIIIFGYNGLIIIFVHFCACMWYFMAECIDEFLSGEMYSWTSNIQYSTLNIDSDISRYQAAVTMMFGYCYHIWKTKLWPQNFHERLFLSLLLVVGFFISVGVYVAMVILLVKKKSENIFAYKINIQIVMRYLNNMSADIPVVLRFMEYYKAFWDYWEGTNEARFINKLPVCTQKNIMQDMFWDALQHSHILKQQNKMLIRAISTRMTCDFLLPGDYIFRRGSVKAKLVYIVSGVAQIMSEQDGISPLLSFSSGTILGDISILFPSISNTDVRCATYCEIRILDTYSFNKTLQDFPSGRYPVQQRALSTIIEASNMVAVADIFTKHDYRMALFNVMIENRIKWMKKRWREIAKENKIFAEQNIRDINQIAKRLPDAKECQFEHTSKYLDLLVLSEEIELKSDRFCLSSRWPFIIEPTCNFLSVWSSVMVTVVIIDCIIVPYYTIFANHLPSWFRQETYLTVITFLCDIYIQAITAIKTREIFIVEPTAIVMYRLKEFKFMICILSTVPLETIANFTGITKMVNYSLYNLNRLLRLVCVVTHCRNLESNILADLKLIRYFKYTLWFFFMVYWFACILQLLACYENLLDCKGTDNSWILTGKKEFESLGFGEEISCFYNKLAMALYLSVSLLIPFGMSIIMPVSMIENIIITIFSIFIFFNLSVYAFSEHISTCILQKKQFCMFRDIVHKVCNFMTECKMPSNIQSLMESYLMCQWKYNYAVDFMPKPILQNTTLELQNEVSKKIIHTLLKVPLFQGNETTGFMNFIDQYVEKCKIFTVPANVQLSNVGQQATNLNVIHRGYCRLYSILNTTNNKPIIIGPGGNFPFIALMHKLPSFVSVYTLTDCELITIKSSDFWNLLLLLPTELEGLEQIQKADGEALKEVFLNKHQLTKTKNLADSDVHNTPNLSGIRAREMWLAPDIEMGRYHIARLLLPFCLMPQGKFVAYWEMFRVCTAVISSLYFPMYYTLLAGQPRLTKNLIALAIDIPSVIDIYIRFHIGYFSDSGLFISHPIYTARYYITHAFFVDLLCAIPWYFILKVNIVLKGYAYVWLTFTRCIPMYRFWIWMSNLNKDMKSVKHYVFRIQTNVVTLIVTWAVANFIALFTCHFYDINGNYVGINCGDVNWLQLSHFNYIKDPISLVFVSFYATVTIFLGTSTGVFRAFDSTEMIFAICLAIVGLAAKFYFMSSALSTKLCEDTSFTTYRERVKSFMEFASEEGGNKEYTRQILDHYSHEWMRTKGVNIQPIIMKIHPTLASDFVLHLFSEALLENDLLAGEDESLFRNLCMHVQEQFFAKGICILNKYDINDLIFFVKKGEVDVHFHEDVNPLALKTGCMFGSFKKTGQTRHRLAFYSRVHTDLLVIKANKFYDIIQYYENAYKKFENAIQPHREYLQTSSNVSVKVLIDEETKLDQTYRCMQWLNTKNTAYKWTDVFVSLAAPYLTIFIVLGGIALKFHGTAHLFAIYLLDIIGVFKIYIRCYTAYVDEESGLMVHDRKKIRKKYFTSLFGVWTDIASTMPIEFLGFFWAGHPVTELRANRLLRVFTLAHYIWFHAHRLYIKLWIRWCDTIVLMTMTPFVCTCLWIMITCDNGCAYWKDINRNETVYTEGPYETFVIAFYQVVSMQVGYALFSVGAPRSMAEMFLMIVTGLMFSNLVLDMIGHVVHKMATNYHSKTRYDTGVQSLGSYLKLRDLSQALLNSAWHYSRYLWTYHRGEWMPYLITKAPYTLKKNIMYNMYGHHLHNNIIFGHSHPEFMKQLASRFTRCIYLPGDSIVEMGDVDQNIYFIHSGQVDAEEKQANEDQLVAVLTTGNFFGAVQGLYKNQPQTYTFRARTLVDILILNYNVWQDLNAAFPADWRLIYSIANSTHFDF